MGWKLTDWARTRLPLSGVPWRDLTDDEMNAAEARHPGIRARGYFRRATPVQPKPGPPSTPRRGFRPKKEN